MIPYFLSLFARSSPPNGPPGVCVCVLTLAIIGLQNLSESDTVSYDALAVLIRSILWPHSVSSVGHAEPQYQAPPVSQSPAQARSTAPGISMSPFTYTTGPNAPAMKAPVPKSPGPLIFKDSPFFTVIESLTPVVECKSMLSQSHARPWCLSSPSC